MPIIANSKEPEIMRCLLERIIARTAVLVFDGEVSRKDPVIVDKPTFYTRVYRIVLDGEPINTWVRFIYDLRDGWADMRISNKDLKEWNKLTKEESKCSTSELDAMLPAGSPSYTGHLKPPAEKPT